MEEIARIRKPTLIIVAVIFFFSMIVWPLLMLPAGVFRSVTAAAYPCMRYINFSLVMSLGGGFCSNTW